jgi:hypothetical protein
MKVSKVSVSRSAAAPQCGHVVLRLWGSAVIGDPGPVDRFSGPVNDRGAMSLHPRRLQVVVRAFYRTLWWCVALHRGENVTTALFIAREWLQHAQ